ncbi:hypothetical protein GGR58DRAFT_493141 [Xylaria digitata]|nr:hypothetical protein GGR58DRAFT_493141 [Xylaria digitata]
MHLQSFIAGVGLVATANALLLPPDLPIADEAVTTLPVPIAIDVEAALSKVPDTQVVDLECPGCLRSGRKHEKEIPSHLKLDFSIQASDGPDRLTLNGYELYPNPDFLKNTLKAPVVPNMAARQIGAPRLRGGLNRPQPNQILGFAMETGTVATDDDEDLQLINVEIQIIEVGDVFIEGIPNVQVKLVKTPSGKLAIGSIDTIQFRGPHSLGHGKECSTTVCKWKALFFEKLSKIFSLKGCDGKRPPPPPPPPHPYHDGEHRHGHGPGPHPHPHPHHMGHRHGWAHGFRIVVTYVVFPIVFGIVAGIAASIIGMMIGTFFVWAWRRVFPVASSRSSHRCRYAHKASKHESAADEEKSGLLDVQEDVEAPPAYMESNVAVAEDKKAEAEV